MRACVDGCTFPLAHAALHLQAWRIICVRRKLGFLTGSAARVALDLPMSVAWTTAHAAVPPALVARAQLGRERNLQRQARCTKQPTHLRLTLSSGTPELAGRLAWLGRDLMRGRRVLPKRRAWQIHLPRPRRSTMLGGEDRLAFVPERSIVPMCAHVARVRACVRASPTHPSMLGIAYGSRCRVTLRISTKVSNATTAHNVDCTAVCAVCTICKYKHNTT